MTSPEIAKLALFVIIASRLVFWSFGAATCSRDRRADAVLFLVIAAALAVIETAALVYLGVW